MIPAAATAAEGRLHEAHEENPQNSGCCFCWPPSSLSLVNIARVSDHRLSLLLRYSSVAHLRTVGSSSSTSSSGLLLLRGLMPKEQQQQASSFVSLALKMSRYIYSYTVSTISLFNALFSRLLLRR